MILVISTDNLIEATQAIGDVTSVGHRLVGPGTLGDLGEESLSFYFKRQLT